MEQNKARAQSLLKNVLRGLEANSSTIEVKKDVKEK